jgi:hypothetical protein
MTRPAPKWARQDLAQAVLGDHRRTNRAIDMLGAIARKGGGTITSVFRRQAARTAAYRFVETLEVTAEALLLAAASACLGRVLPRAPFFFVALDFCFLTFLSAPKSATGPVGTTGKPTNGLVAFNGLALTPTGVPLGLAYQSYFARDPKRARPKGGCKRCRKRFKACRKGRARRQSCSHRQEARKALPLELKETRFWLKAMNFVVDLCGKLGLKARPWFQCDRGGDFWELLQWAGDAKQAYVTVRATTDRRLADGGTVRTHLKKQRVLYRTTVEVPEGEHRKARTAQLSVRACRVEVANKRKGGTAELGVVWVREIGKVPPGEKRLDWLLWTNYPVKTKKAVMQVVAGYRSRWGVEEFHKVWKSSCGVEKSQLRSQNGLKVWATLLAMAAARIQRLMKRSREEPEVPALEEFSEVELLAIQVLKEQKPRKNVTLGEAVRWVADLGGYTGKSSGGPPGAIVIARGLEDIRSATQLALSLIEQGFIKK